MDSWRRLVWCLICAFKYFYSLERKTVKREVRNLLLSSINQRVWMIISGCCWVVFANPTSWKMIKLGSFQLRKLFSFPDIWIRVDSNSYSPPLCARQLWVHSLLPEFYLIKFMWHFNSISKTDILIHYTFIFCILVLSATNI